MTERYSISLERAEDSLEPYEERDCNVARVRVQFPSGEIVSDPRYRVELTLSTDAMLGLGTELIRLAKRTSSLEGAFHIRPIEKSFASQTLGIFLVPGSCELIVAHNEFGAVEEIIQDIESAKDRD